MMTHRSKKPFECKYDNCDKSYCDARSLRRHLENHHHQPSLDSAAAMAAGLPPGAHLDGDGPPPYGNGTPNGQYFQFDPAYRQRVRDVLEIPYTATVCLCVACNSTGKEYVTCGKYCIPQLCVFVCVCYLQAKGT